MQPIRVMVVDDSVVIRGILTRMLEEDPAIKVVAVAANGRSALDTLRHTETDVVVLDIEMPVMDGLAALPQILALVPGIKVIMASALTHRGAEVSLAALRLGAADYIPKPSGSGLLNTAEFKREIVAKVRALGAARARLQKDHSARVMGAPAGNIARSADAVVHGTPIQLRPASMKRPAIIGIGTSTGGPQALMAVLPALPASLLLPIVIVQHMPPIFTRLLAEQLASATRRPTMEGADGMPVRAGHIYIAPGGFHMSVVAGKPDTLIRITDSPPENFCRPAVDVLLRSLAIVYGAATLAVILTGMGRDGALGGGAVATAGGTVLAQDEATSVVWGMPGAAAAAGLCSELLALPAIGRRIAQYAAGTTR
jgi:two-component system, chemotaxis family, protein-glutamate methylesterase/glutaminase